MQGSRRLWCLLFLNFYSFPFPSVACVWGPLKYHLDLLIWNTLAQLCVGSGREGCAPLAVGATGVVILQVLHPWRAGAVGCCSVCSGSICYFSERVGCVQCSHPTGVDGAQPCLVLIHSCPASPPGKSFPNEITNRNLHQTVSKHEWASSPKCFQTQIDFPPFLLLYQSQIIHFHYFAVLQLLL